MDIRGSAKGKEPGHVEETIEGVGGGKDDDTHDDKDLVDTLLDELVVLSNVRGDLGRAGGFIDKKYEMDTCQSQVGRPRTGRRTIKGREGRRD